ncbi:GNAT family N-acetyltransferase [Aureimonas glaciei]|uniref:N-acetyltransferase domain-containing protein n=1 Tax=Aureimonas glaciei TaxID=1776957 RepID=A0A916Y4G6_9HYPH|nr:GNAT family N-acetyltransferase [Aureimonas glaciei]GGD29277.1 hypothetical protein GCM10011335_35520 [Aureimonas glaciei]
MTTDIFFGSEAQQEMQRRAAALWQLVSDDSRFAYEGRCVALDGASPAVVDLSKALVVAQGGSASFFVKASDEDKVTAALNAEGFSTDRWEHLMGAETSVGISRDILAKARLPDGYRICEIGPESSAEEVRQFVDLALSCGVLPPAGMALRGLTRNSVAYLLLDPQGRGISCSGAVARHHPESPFGDSAWWGMLATREDMRGRGFSVHLGALALTSIAERFGVHRFYTGVRRDNLVSMGLCRKLGLGDHGLVVIAALDRKLFGDAQITK